MDRNYTYPKLNQGEYSWNFIQTVPGQIQTEILVRNRSHLHHSP